jgi:hypothetical protein
MWSAFTAQNRIFIVVLGDALRSKRLVATLLSSFILISLTLQWLLEYEQFQIIFIENQAQLSLAERLDVLTDSFLALFRYINDLTPIGIVLVSFFQAIAIMFWVWARRLQLKERQISLSSLGLGLVGAGCVACGGSLLPLIFSITGTTLAAAVLESVASLLLIIAAILAYRVTLRLSLQIARVTSRYGR